MLTGELRNQVDRRLDDLHTLEETKANRLKQPMERRIFPAGKDGKKRPYEDLRWSHFRDMAPADMFTVIGEHAFPFLRTLGGNGSTYAQHMKDARFTVPTAALLARVVDLLDKVPMEDRDTKGDVYEYMLGKIATAGQNGQFRTPRHVIRLMVEMVAPGPRDVICDPACGTCGFLGVRRRRPIIRVRLNRAELMPQYACQYVNSPGGRRHLLRAGKTTSGLNTISVSEVRATPIAIPPISLQRDFADRVADVGRMKHVHRASLVQMDALFASLQHRAFRGEI